MGDRPQRRRAALLITLLITAEQRLLYIPGRTVHHASGGYRGEGKTHAKEAAVIADQARMRRDLQPLRAGDDIAVELRILTAGRTDLVADRTRAINRLRAQLLEYFPALERAFDYSKSKAALILLTGYQTPDGLRRACAARLAAWLRKHTPMRLWPPPSRQPTPSTPWYLDNNWPRPWWLGWPRR